MSTISRRRCQYRFLLSIFKSQFTELDQRERERDRDRQTDRDRETETDRQTDRERQRQTDRGRDRQRETERGSLAMHFNIREGFLIKQLNKIFERTLPTEVTASNLYWQAVQRRAVVGYYDGT